MEQLPDEVLLLVLQHVNVAGLFSCRLVCKRIACLSMEPSVWRHQRMDRSWDANFIRLTCRVLSLAPCLKKLSLDLSKKLCHLSFLTTKCAVEELSISSGSIGGSANHVTFLIRNQAALGRLKKLDVNLYSFSEASHEEKCVMISTIMSISGLEKLSLRCDDFTGFSEAAQHCSLPEPSLKYFGCTLMEWSFCNLILAAHASTLEVASLHSIFASQLSSTASVLAGMRNLRKLYCGMLPEMEAVAACKSLKELSLDVVPGQPPTMASAMAFLRRAKHLRSVTLDYIFEDELPSDVDLVLALAQCKDDFPIDADLILALDSGPSQLESLTIENTHGPKAFPQVKSLINALPSLVALQDLELCVYEGLPSDELLEAIRPDATPALRCLTFKNYLGLGEVKCVHAWLHRDEVRTALLSNPLLHIKVNPFDEDEACCIYCSVDRCETCQACQLDCPQAFDRLSYDMPFLGLLSHSPQVKCELDYSNDCVWMQIQ